MQRASGCLNKILKLMAYLLAALLIFTLPVSILANNILRTFFSPSEISEAVSSLVLMRGGLREQLVDNVFTSSWLDKKLTEGRKALVSLDPVDRIRITQILFPDDWVKSQVDENIGNLIAWIESEEPLPELILDLEPLRVQLQEGGSYQVAEILVNSWPPCTVEQAQVIRVALQQATPARFDFCNPEGELHKQLIDFLDRQLKTQVDSISSEISLLDETDSREASRNLEEIRRDILVLLLLLRWIRLLPFLLLGLLMTLVIRSWSDLRMWWGIPVGLGALFGIVLILIGHFVGPGLIKDSLLQSAQPVELQETIINTIWELIATVLNRSAFQALVLIILVAVGMTLPLLLKRRTPKVIPEPPVEPTPEDRMEDLPPPPQVEPFNPETLSDIHQGENPPEERT